MARRLERKLDGYRISTRVLRAAAEHLQVEDEGFDCVVSTLVLCAVKSPSSALAEVRRALKPGGQLRFLEHLRSDDPRIALWQDRLRRPWAWFGCGCQCNRSTVQSLREAGFSLTDLRHDELPKAPPIVRPLVVGVAVRDG